MIIDMIYCNALELDRSVEILHWRNQLTEFGAKKEEQSVTMSKRQIREKGDREKDVGDPERRGRMDIKCGIIWKNLSMIESCWAEWKSANHEEI